MDDATLARFAELAVDFGANLQPGQIVSRRRRARQGATCPGDRAERLPAAGPSSSTSRGSTRGSSAPGSLHAADDTLEFVPPWYGERILALGARARRGDDALRPVAPGLLDDLDPVRAGPRPAARDQRDRRGRQPPRDQLDDPARARPRRGPTSSTPTSSPTPRWPARGAARARPAARRGGPVAAWTQRADTLVGVAERLTERGFDALHYEGPGTDLTVGLLPGTRWQAARFETADGIRHMPNLPTEEVFTSPDPDARPTAT